MVKIDYKKIKGLVAEHIELRDVDGIKELTEDDILISALVHYNNFIKKVAEARRIKA